MGATLYSFTVDWVTGDVGISQTARFTIITHPGRTRQAFVNTAHAPREDVNYVDEGGVGPISLTYTIFLDEQSDPNLTPLQQYAYLEGMGGEEGVLVAPDGDAVPAVLTALDRADWNMREMLELSITARAQFLILEPLVMHVVLP